MRQPWENWIRSTNAPRRLSGDQASARTVLLVLIFFLFGLAGGAYWYYRATKHAPVNETPLALSDSTRAVLKRLDSAIEIRFYSLLDPASVSDSVRAFAGRVDQLLAEYQQEANGKVKLTRYDSLSDANAQAASADGIQPFNREKGDACYLGIAVAQGQQKESLPQLAPEWEPAVEFDLTRAIVRLINARPTANNPVTMARPDKAAIEEVKRAIPDLASVSVEKGTQILKDATLKEFAAASNEMEIRIKEAQRDVSNAQQGKSETEQQAAMRHLQQVQLEQAEKLKEIAARLPARIAALQGLKKE